MIGVIVFPDFQLLDAAGPISVFEIAGRYAQSHGKSATQIKVISATPGPVRSSSGVEMLARKFGSPSAITTLPFLTEQAKRNILGLNAARVFNLEVKRKRPKAKDVLAARPGIS